MSSVLPLVRGLAFQTRDETPYDRSSAYPALLATFGILVVFIRSFPWDLLVRLDSRQFVPSCCPAFFAWLSKDHLRAFLLTAGVTGWLALVPDDREYTRLSDLV